MARAKDKVAELLVEGADIFEHAARPASQVDSVDNAFVVTVVPPRPAACERRLERGGDATPHSSRALRYPRATHIVCAGLPENSQALQ